MPAFVPPMLPTLVESPPEGDQWLHEIKHDGYRTQLHISLGGSSAYTRNGHDWSELYRCVLDVAQDIVGRPAVLDGEIVVQDERGRSDFHSLRGCISGSPDRLVFYAFDLLSLDGQDLRREPLLDRRRRLQSLIAGNEPNCCVQFGEHVAGDGEAFFKAAEAMDLEGIVSKKMTSRYTSGRSSAWLKTKAFITTEFVVMGHEEGLGPRIALLGRIADHGRLELVGRAFITLPAAQRERFWREMDRLACARPHGIVGRTIKAHWVKPEIRVRVKHLRGGGKLRHATLSGLLD